MINETSPVCDACGRSFDSHDVLQRGEARAHQRLQERYFGRQHGRRVTHYTADERIAEEHKMRHDAYRVVNQRALDALLGDVERELQWLVTLASAHLAEDALDGVAGALWTLFRQEARIEEARKQVRLDYLDARDAGRWAA